MAETRIAERAYCRRYLGRRLRNIALLVCLTVAVGIGSLACRQVVARNASRTASELAEVTGRTVEIKREISSLDAQLSQRAWRRQLARSSDRWLSAFDALLICLPQDVWLSRVEASSKDSGISVEGNATSYETLSQFVSRLRVNSAFSDVQLRSAKASGVNGTFVDFALLAKIGDSAAAQQSEQKASVPNVSHSP